MTGQAKDEEREERIHMEIIVDAYGPEEQAISWYYYLEENLHVPFSARCVVRRTISPLEPEEEVTGGTGFWLMPSCIVASTITEKGLPGIT